MVQQHDKWDGKHTKTQYTHRFTGTNLKNPKDSICSYSMENQYFLLYKSCEIKNVWLKVSSSSYSGNGKYQTVEILRSKCEPIT